MEICANCYMVARTSKIRGTAWGSCDFMPAYAFVLVMCAQLFQKSSLSVYQQELCTVLLTHTSKTTMRVKPHSIFDITLDAKFLSVWRSLKMLPHHTEMPSLTQNLASRKMSSNCQSKILSLLEHNLFKHLCAYTPFFQQNLMWLLISSSYSYLNAMYFFCLFSFLGWLRWKLPNKEQQCHDAI